MESKLKKGDVAPDFSLPNEDNVEISLRDLGEKTIILYFYPKDNTSGCTTEAQEFSALKAEFERLDCVIIGISPDKTSTHKKFIESKNLNIILLSDEKRAVASKYHAFGKKMMYGKEVQGIIRSTFIIKNGKILESFYNVRAKGHAQKVLECVEKL
ncbi:redoxin domain-containing protein [Helicobacter saguini]|uniref:Putative peroxiredoxin bcp n=1 Tax=Helicobacter saguini TaxID=1548018 RepID=A0A347VNL0_9HELI|nr:peroxiredoxin [Helicobacter saguini]MWV61728.1 redoxin domain-containing protein [Helicobacter saguini]MWV67600.1 redoxin domain-containing protein [Helicobacter saguini]MWV69951.1 redoxin domain-containing protein [Helicobacter saguini]MWV72835.1 redoxin domain-containing protein [Helicobacter saguini]TLD92374.1 peroxiredoxin [Helicobacter saguini]